MKRNQGKWGGGSGRSNMACGSIKHNRFDNIAWSE